jgi:hypothetical protein
MNWTMLTHAFPASYPDFQIFSGTSAARPVPAARLSQNSKIHPQQNSREGELSPVLASLDSLDRLEWHAVAVRGALDGTSVPELLGYRDGHHLHVRPPICFVAIPVQLVMVFATERHREFVADLSP